MKDMTINEIKAAVVAGKKVFCGNHAYQVIQNSANPEDFLIVCSINQYTIGLHGRKGTDYAEQLNGKDFWIEEDHYTVLATHNGHTVPLMFKEPMNAEEAAFVGREMAEEQHNILIRDYRDCNYAASYSQDDDKFYSQIVLINCGDCEVWTFWTEKKGD